MAYELRMNENVENRSSNTAHPQILLPIKSWGAQRNRWDIVACLIALMTMMEGERL